MHRMRPYTTLSAVLLLCLASAFAGCGGGSEPPPPLGGNPPSGSNMAPVSLAITDAPPAGVSVLSFEVTVLGAVLQPGNVQLITTPVPIEVKRLEVDASVLSTLNVPAGTYTSLAVTFSNPELTIRNDSNVMIAAICAAGAVCEFKLPVTSTFTARGAPLLLVRSGDATGLLIDLALNNLITDANTVDFNAAGGVVVTQFPTSQAAGQLEDLEAVKGRISAVGDSGNEFSLQIATGRTLIFRVDANTRFEDFNDPGGINCAANNLSCLTVGQIVEVSARLMAGGLLLAREVDAIDNDLEEELEGIIVGLENAASPTFFEMVLTDEAVNAAGVEVGQRVRVNLVGNVLFRIDADNLPVNSADFDAASDLSVGQVVEVERRSTLSVSGTPSAPMFDTDRVILKDTRLTGFLQSVNTSTNVIIIDNLPTLYGITTLEVRVTPGQTEFKNATGIGGLMLNDPISVRGLLLKGSTSLYMTAKKIRERPGASGACEGCWDY